MLYSWHLRLVLSISLFHCLVDVGLCSTASTSRQEPSVPRAQSPPPHHYIKPRNSLQTSDRNQAGQDQPNYRRAGTDFTYLEQKGPHLGSPVIARSWATPKVLWTRAVNLFRRAGTSSSGSSSDQMSSEDTSVSGTNGQYLIRKKKRASLPVFTELVQKHEESKGRFSTHFPDIDAYEYVTLLSAKDKATLEGRKDVIVGIWPDRQVDAIAFTPTQKRDVGDKERLGTRVPDAIRKQNLSPLHLKRLSQAKLQLDANLPDFMYREEAGKGVYLYILGSGLRMDHEEFGRGFPRQQPQEHYVPADLSVIGTDRIMDNLDHDTCIASLAVGTRSGGAKLAIAIPVKFKEAPTLDRSVVPPRVLTGGLTRMSILTNVWYWTINDVVTKGRKGKAVVNMSYGFEPRHMMDDQGQDVFHDLLQGCWDHDIVTVVAGGNRPGYHLGMYTPQKLATPQNALIVVGGTTENCKLWESGTLNFENKMTLYAPAIGVTCASSRGDTRIETHDGRDVHSAPGTSLSAGIVSGTAVYLLSLASSSTSSAHNLGLHAQGQVSLNVKRELVNLSHHRRTNGHPGPNMVYNGVHEVSLAQRKRGLSI